MGYAIGAQVPLPYTVRDGSGQLVDVASMSITVTSPDGTTAATLTIGSGITRQSLGTYLGIFTPTDAGRHTWSGVTTAPATALPADAFNVVAATDAPLVGLAEARSWLNMGSPDHDALILRALSKATEVAEQWTGETFRRTTFTEVLDGGDRSLRLLRYPVLSVSQVVEDSTTLTADDWTLDQAVGLLKRGGPTSCLRWAPGWQNITVTYVAGYEVIPDRILGGVEELTRHIFGAIRAGDDADDAYTQTVAIQQMCVMLLGPAGPVI